MSILCARPARIKPAPLPRRKTRPRPMPRPRPNLRDAWPTWTDQRWTVATPAPGLDFSALAVPTCVFETEGPMPTAEEGFAPTAEEGFAPTSEDEACWSGFTLRLEDEAAADPPAEFGLLERAEFRLGQLAGMLARFRREDDDLEEQARRIERLEEAYREHHSCETIEAVGCIEARRA